MNNNCQLKQQQGATMWSTLSIGLMIGFIALIAFKLVPVYIDHGIIRGSMQELVNQRDFRQMTAKQILLSMEKRMMVDNIRGFGKDAFTVSREKSGEKFIIIEYSAKVPIAGNVSASVDFKEEIRPVR
ncbi:DUF4845 domain-containing protein [Aliikangiella coralliicola]|uniref:DUF4845 domain-containing protein n=1 Tax=Aliikangiella coralliicola TaxID=2592383 RepID=A0A545UB29_9GAMM|nr:DUF4845 domain-containing protein [Aliikangiella coralliicola]TQV86676.1 DUF4845 domain-containing protein [Aliikangiella coralliicola]